MTISNVVISPANESAVYPTDLITLTCSSSGVAIYYTLDGSTPTKDSNLYTVPFVIGSATEVTAKAFTIYGDEYIELETGEDIGYFKIDSTSEIDIILNNVSLYYNKDLKGTVTQWDTSFDETTWSWGNRGEYSTADEKYHVIYFGEPGIDPRGGVTRGNMMYIKGTEDNFSTPIDLIATMPHFYHSHTYPRMTVDSNGYVHLIIYDGYIYYGTNKTGTWVEEELIEIYDMDDDDNDLDIVVDANGYVHIAALMSEYDDGDDVGVYYITNKTGSWTSERNVQATDYDYMAGGVQIDVDKNGIIHIIYGIVPYSGSEGYYYIYGSMWSWSSPSFTGVDLNDGSALSMKIDANSVVNFTSLINPPGKFSTVLYTKNETSTPLAFTSEILYPPASIDLTLWKSNTIILREENSHIFILISYYKTYSQKIVLFENSQDIWRTDTLLEGYEYKSGSTDYLLDFVYDFDVNSNILYYFNITHSMIGVWVETVFTKTVTNTEYDLNVGKSSISIPGQEVTIPASLTIYDIPVIQKEFYDGIDKRTFETQVLQKMITSIHLEDYKILTDFANIKFTNTDGICVNMQYNSTNRTAVINLTDTLPSGIDILDDGDRYILTSGEYTNYIATCSDSTSEIWIYKEPTTDDILTVTELSAKYIYSDNGWMVIPQYEIPLKLDIEVFKTSSYTGSDTELGTKIRETLISSFQDRFGSNISLYRSELINVIHGISGIDHCRILNPETNIFFNFDLTKLTKEELLTYGPEYIYFDSSTITIRII